MGAVLEDGSLTAARSFILRTLKPTLAQLEAGSDVTDVKSRLQALTQAARGLTPVYRTLEMTGPDHARTFRVAVLLDDQVVAEGEGQSKRAAERAAAAKALRLLAEAAP